ncbi:MAG TPA: LytR C-terminal domain-containing protein [Acidimicrobiales bacterium]|nr:LytR C-terminal domain-containing protein [Acidimicrobiales bacterium]
MSQDDPSPESGSFVRSASGAMLRGVMLIVVAVVLGIVLLQGTDGPDPFTAATEDTTGTEDVTDNGDDGDTPPTFDGDGNVGDVGETTDTTDTTEVPPPDVDPSTITVLVANGSGGVAGLAAAVTEVVTEAGYETVPPTNSKAVESSVVYYAPGFQEAAAAVAQLFDPAPEVAPLPDPSPVDDLRGANVVLVASGDLAE